jgi:membrane peptidoglycan carboxypeptidase
MEAKRVTDHRDQGPRTPRPPQAPRTDGGQHRRPAMPSDPDGTGVWTPSWDDDSTDGRGFRPPQPADPAATQYYSPARPDQGPSRPGSGSVADPESTDYIPRVPTAQREPELITHREPLPPEPPRGYVPPPGGPGGPGAHGAGTSITPEQEAALRRKRIWRRVRRIGYAGAAGLIIVPILSFLIGYSIIDVPSFSAVANRQQQPVTLYYSDGKTELAALNPTEGNRINIKYEDLPEHVRNAVLAAEDRTFFTNPGFDARGIVRAVWRQANGEAGGGSGITQQYVKVATNEDEFSLKRKFKEVIIATKISRNTPKEQILQNYLNIIYFGRQAYGIQAASQAYFGKDVKDLSVSEGALLAGMIQSPSRSDPLKNPERATNRWNFVLDGMVEQGWLSAADRAGQQFPKVIGIHDGPGSVADFRRHIQNQVEAELADQGIDQATLNRIGGRIITTIDKPAQDKAVDAVNKVLKDKPENLHASLVAVDPKTGAVRAYFGGQDGTGYDLAGGTAWQPGSSFKPFVMLAGLEHNPPIGLGAMYPGKGPLVINGYTVDNSESADYPDLSLKDAMTKSVNTAFVKLADDVGPTTVQNAAYQAGIPKKRNDKQTLVNSDGTPPGLAIGLGAYEVRTLDMAAAYASFASQGTRHEPYFVQEYVGADNQSRYKHIDKPVPAFDDKDRERNAQLACNVTDSMVDVPASSKFPLADGRVSAAKTGTAQRGSTGENANTWTVGYTPSISAAVWVGDPAQTALKIGTRNIFGSTVAGPIWKAFMDGYLEGKPKENFPKCKTLGNETTTTAPPNTAPPTTTEPSTTTPTGKQTRTRPTSPTSLTTTAESAPICGGTVPCPLPTTTATTSSGPTPPGRGG